MGNRRIIVAFGALAAMSVALAARADSIKLDSGKTIEGTVVTETSGVVQIAVGGATLTIPRSRIAAVTKGAAEPSLAGAGALAQLETLETKGQWPDLYEAATRLLTTQTSNPVALEKQKLAADKIRESLGGKAIAELVRGRRFDEAITTLTERLRKSGLSTRGAGAVGRRALAELYVGSARIHLRNSQDGHVPLGEARKARELDPSTPGLDYVEGMAQMNLHNFDPAIALLERAARAEPANFGITLQLMTCYREKGDFARLVGLIEATAAETSASARSWPEVREIVAAAYGQVAAQLADQGRKAEAAAAYEKRLAFCERTAEDLREAAAFFERLGDYERAKALRSERPRPKVVETQTTGSLTSPRLRR